MSAAAPEIDDVLGNAREWAEERLARIPEDPEEGWAILRGVEECYEFLWLEAQAGQIEERHAGALEEVHTRLEELTATLGSWSGNETAATLLRTRLQELHERCIGPIGEGGTEELVFPAAKSWGCARLELAVELFTIEGTSSRVAAVEGRTWSSEVRLLRAPRFVWRVLWEASRGGRVGRRIYREVVGVEARAGVPASLWGVDVLGAEWYEAATGLDEATTAVAAGLWSPEEVGSPLYRFEDAVRAARAVMAAHPVAGARTPSMQETAGSVQR